MNEPKTRDVPEDFADRMIAAGESEIGIAKEPQPREPQAPKTDRAFDATFQHLLSIQTRFERRLRWAALFCWSLTFSALVTGVASIGVIRNGAGSSVEWARMILIVAGAISAVSVFAALLTSFQWLFHTHTPTLRAIERRLAALEERLLAG